MMQERSITQCERTSIEGGRFGAHFDVLAKGRRLHNNDIYILFTFSNSPISFHQFTCTFSFNKLIICDLFSQLTKIANKLKKMATCEDLSELTYFKSNYLKNYARYILLLEFVDDSLALQSRRLIISPSPLFYYFNLGFKDRFL